MESLDSSFYSHGLTETSWQTNEDIPSLMKDVIKACVKPFTYSGNNLVSPVNGVEATSDAAKIAGEKTLVELVSQRIWVQTTKYNAQKENKSKTFSTR